MPLPLSAEIRATVDQAQVDLGVVRGVHFTLTLTNTGQVVEFELPLPPDSNEVATELELADLQNLPGPWAVSAEAVGQDGSKGPARSSAPLTFTLVDPTPTVLDALTIT